MDFDRLELEKVNGFDWDDGDLLKNEKKHGIRWQEIEEVFFNKPILVQKDILHSRDESRCFALGTTDNEVRLFIAFTKRNMKIRVISARPMNKKVRSYYEDI